MLRKTQGSTGSPPGGRARERQRGHLERDLGPPFLFHTSSSPALAPLPGSRQASSKTHHRAHPPADRPLALATRLEPPLLLSFDPPSAAPPPSHPRQATPPTTHNMPSGAAAALLAKALPKASGSGTPNGGGGGSGRSPRSAARGKGVRGAGSAHMDEDVGMSDSSDAAAARRRGRQGRSGPMGERVSLLSLFSALRDPGAVAEGRGTRARAWYWLSARRASMLPGRKPAREGGGADSALSPSPAAKPQRRSERARSALRQAGTSLFRPDLEQERQGPRRSDPVDHRHPPPLPPVAVPARRPAPQPREHGGRPDPQAAQAPRARAARRAHQHGRRPVEALEGALPQRASPVPLVTVSSPPSSCQLTLPAPRRDRSSRSRSPTTTSPRSSPSRPGSSPRTCPTSRTSRSPATASSRSATWTRSARSSARSARTSSPRAGATSRSSSSRATRSPPRADSPTPTPSASSSLALRRLHLVERVLTLLYPRRPQRDGSPLRHAPRPRPEPDRPVHSVRRRPRALDVWRRRARPVVQGQEREGQGDQARAGRLPGRHHARRLLRP